MTELDLISRSLVDQVQKTRDSTALSQLIDLHTGIYVNTVKSYSAYPDFRNKVEANDLMGDKAYHIFQFALKFKPDKGMTFGSYVGDRTKNLCQAVIYRKPLNSEFNEDVAPSNDTSAMETIERETSIEAILDEVAGSDSAQFRQIFKLRYCGQRPRSWRVIAPMVGMSYEGCRKLYNKHIGAVKERLKS